MKSALYGSEIISAFSVETYNGYNLGNFTSRQRAFETAAIFTVYEVAKLSGICFGMNFEEAMEVCEWNEEAARAIETLKTEMEVFSHGGDITDTDLITIRKIEIVIG